MDWTGISSFSSELYDVYTNCMLCMMYILHVLITNDCCVNFGSQTICTTPSARIVIRTSCPILILVSPQLRIQRIFQAPDCLKLDYKIREAHSYSPNYCPLHNPPCLYTGSGLNKHKLGSVPGIYTQAYMYSTTISMVFFAGLHYISPLHCICLEVI